MKYHKLVGNQTLLQDTAPNMPTNEQTIVGICARLKTMADEMESIECWELSEQIRAHIETLKSKYLSGKAA